ncbi:MAG: hypothetical protein QOJ96_688 [Alphaproteobacteria bacterium]|jgi:hypothetical protein|nr:hypothetical protein [Alphaproteobacteria bacterium]
MRALFIFGCLLGGAIAAYYGQPLAHENADSVLVIITVMTVFAGFLVAIITILGDPGMIPSGSWRVAELRRNNIEARLITHIWLFVFYLIAIGFLFAGVLLHKAHGVSIEWKIWIERLYLFFGVSAFLLTFGLPIALLRFQLGRIDAEIERRRREAGISEDKP